jgi:RNA polymerase sigma-70 factor (ECF subfamily)
VSTPSPAEADEQDLLARLRGGGEAAFRELVLRYGPRLLSVARRLLGSEEEARDAVQEAFLQAYRSLAGFRGQAQLGTWLHRITTNAALMRLRRQRTRPEETAIEPLLPSFLADGHQAEPAVPWVLPTASALDRLERRERSRLVRDAIDQLPAGHRAVLLLRDIDERSTAETASLLGISENAVKIRLHRARQALRGLLDPHFRPPDEAAR